MIINKITTGFVVQKFDTTTNKWLSQEFIAGDCEYENELGEMVNSDHLGQPEPYLPFEMKQPN